MKKQEAEYRDIIELLVLAGQPAVTRLIDVIMSEADEQDCPEVKAWKATKLVDDTGPSDVILCEAVNKQYVRPEIKALKAMHAQSGDQNSAVWAGLRAAVVKDNVRNSVILELLAEIGQERAVEILAPIMVAESPRHPNRISSRYDPIYGALALIEHCHLEAAMAALLTHEDETVRYMALALLFGEKPGDDNDELLEEVDQAPILDAPLAVKTAAEMLATTKNMDDADMAARALGRFRSSSTDGVQVLIDRWHYDDSSEEDHAWLQEIILIALAHQADPRAVPIFLETLTDERLHFRSNGYKGIAAVENAALVPLLNLWKTTQPHGQESLMLACALARLGDASGLQIMLDFLKRFEDLAGKPPSREPDAEDVVERQYEAHVCLDALSYLDEPRSNAVLEHWVMVEPYYRVLAIENDAVEGLARFTASLDSKVADRLFHDWVLAPTSKRSWNSRMIAARTLVMRNDPRIVGQLITMLDSPV